jgi:hypothetical protein
MGVRVSSAQIVNVAIGSATGSSVAGASVGAGAAGFSVAGASVGTGVAPPHADNKSPNTMMTENMVTNFFIMVLLLFQILITN